MKPIRSQVGPSVAEMESRGQKPKRPQMPVSIESIPSTPAEEAKVPEAVPENVAVRTEH